jgi:hypothetical protein
LGLAALAACGGGGSSAAPPTPTPTATPTPTPSPTPSATAVPANEAHFSITLPATTTTAARNRQTIGSGTASIKFTLLQPSGGTPQTFPLNAQQTYCVSNQSQLTCTLAVVAPIGLDVFLAQTYDGNNNLTGSGAVQFNVAINNSNVESLSLTSQVSSVYLASSASYLGEETYFLQSGSDDFINRSPEGVRHPTQAVSSSMNVFVIALDSANNTILDPSVYTSPITLQVIYTDSYLNVLTSPVADVALDVTPTSYDSSGCGATGATPSPAYAVVQVCSPGDAITASIPNSVTSGAAGFVLVGSVNGSGNLAISAPIPNSTPAGVGILEIPVGFPSGSISVIGQ